MTTLTKLAHRFGVWLTLQWSHHIGEFSVGAAVGLFVAVASVSLAEYKIARRYTRLRFSLVQAFEQDALEPEIEPDTGQVKLDSTGQFGLYKMASTTYWRLPITNVGRRASLDTRCELLAIGEPNGEAREGFLPSPLAWTHETSDYIRRTFSPGEVALLDIGSRLPSGEFKLGSPPIAALPRFSSVVRGPTTLAVGVSNRSGQLAILHFIVSVDDQAQGGWQVTIERELKRRRRPQRRRSLVEISNTPWSPDEYLKD